LSSNHKVIKTLDEKVFVDQIFGLKFIPYKIETRDKSNFILHIWCKVTQTGHHTHDVGFYLLKEKEFLDWLPELYASWAFPIITPSKFVISLPPKIEHRIDIPVTKNENVYLILDNRHSNFSTKDVAVIISEEFDITASSD